MEFPLPRLLVPLVCLLLVPTLARAADGEDGKLEKFFKDYLDQRFRQQPLDATRLGDHRFDHLLDDVSPAGRACVGRPDRGRWAGWSGMNLSGSARQ